MHSTGRQLKWHGCLQMPALDQRQLGVLALYLSKENEENRRKKCLQPSESEENFIELSPKLVTSKDSTVILQLAAVGGHQESHQAEVQQPGMSGTPYSKQLDGS